MSRWGRWLLAVVSLVGCAAGSSASPATTTVAVLAAPTAVQAEIPQKALDVLAIIDRTGKAPPGYVGGRTFENRERRLARRTADGKTIAYREWDVNPKRTGVDRGPQRLVTGNDRSAYYTADHYSTFTRIR